MSTPSNQFGPYWRQRWIEAKNDDTVDLAAFSVADVTGAERPETGSTLTPLGGRTILKVKRAQKDNPKGTVVLGPMPIAAGDYGPVTDANVCYARYSGTVAVGDIVGVKKTENVVQRGYGGFVVLGDITTDHGTICRVERLGGGGNLYIGKLANAIPADSTGLFNVHQQTGTGMPTVPTGEQFLVLNITGTELQTAVYMYAEEINYFDMKITFPAEIDECFQPDNQVQSGGG